MRATIVELGLLVSVAALVILTVFWAPMQLNRWWFPH